MPRGKTGEFCTRGYSVMKGNWNDPEKTRDAIDEAGWMHTGDLATMDAEGYVNIVGRLKDMVIRVGENVYPREIEEFPYAHPKIQDVQVIGVPDPKYGEETYAWIQLHTGFWADRTGAQELATMNHFLSFLTGIAACVIIFMIGTNGGERCKTFYNVPAGGDVTARGFRVSEER